MDVVIVGAGGHGKVVLDILRTAGQHKAVGFIDADQSLAGTNVSGLDVLGAPNILPKLKQQKIRGVIIAIGDNRTRVEYAAKLRTQGFELINAIHPTASISASASLGVNIVIAMQAAICAEAQLGNSVIINTAAVVDHECVVESGAHICPGVHLAGRVRVGAGAFIGIGANVIQCLTIGEYATVGAGAVVVSDVNDEETVVGVPAHRVKPRVHQ